MASRFKGRNGEKAQGALFAAPAVLLLATGVAMYRAHQEEQTIAAESMLTAPAVPVSSAIRPTLQDDREARIRFLFGR